MAKSSTGPMFEPRPGGTTTQRPLSRAKPQACEGSGRDGGRGKLGGYGEGVEHGSATRSVEIPCGGSVLSLHFPPYPPPALSFGTGRLRLCLQYSPTKRGI